MHRKDMFIGHCLYIDSPGKPYSTVSFKNCDVCPVPITRKRRESQTLPYNIYFCRISITAPLTCSSLLDDKCQAIFTYK